MRQAKVCPACGKECAPSALDCGSCAYPLDHVDVSIIQDEPAPPDPAPPPSSPTEDARGAVMPCGQPCVPTRQPDGTCFDCGRPLTAALPTPVRVWVNWPWNRRTEIMGSLCVGRVEPSPAELAARLESNFDNVSRRHATLTLAGETLSVCDHGSANGTYLDGARLAPHTPVVVGPGASLRFAADLTVNFTWEKPAPAPEADR